jgi:hypothetical protein
MAKNHMNPKITIFYNYKFVHSKKRCISYATTRWYGLLNKLDLCVMVVTLRESNLGRLEI